MSELSAHIAAQNLKPEGYLALLGIARSITSNRSLNELFQELACQLRGLFEFRDIGILLHDGSQNVMRVHTLESCGPDSSQATFEVPVQGSVAGWVWQNQAPAVVSDLDKDPRFTARNIREYPLKSICCLPLTTAQRRLGAFNFWSDRIGAYGNLDLEFAQLVANQIAVAVDNALTYEVARSYEKQLARERDRSRLLLEINNTLVSNLHLRDLLKTISACLRQVMQQDVAGLALHDAEINKLRVIALDFPAHEDVFIENEIIDLEGTPAGRCFTTRQPVMSRLDHLADPIGKRAGLKSGCTVPLISHDRVLGILGVAKINETPFSEDDAELLNQIGKQIAIAVENALAFREIATLKNKLQEEKLYLQEEIRTEYNFEEIIGNSAALKRALQNVETVAPTDSAVLIFGETGTGKELIARALHNLSARREHPLVKVNCAAIPTGLLESEMFGHEKGAFTGAVGQRKGRFELADKGTIFLDEVEEIPLELQSKLLRVLQEQEFERLGSGRTIHVDVRVVAATNADLAQMIAEKKFRSDLYYRLNVFPVNLPALRERPEDIPLLISFFAQKFARRMKKRLEKIPTETMSVLTSYSWPGNIRELQNLIERAVILSRGSVLEVPLTELKQSAVAAASVSDESSTLEAVEREHILETLRESRWVIGGSTGAAARLGLNRTTLYARMRKLGISRPRCEY